MGECLFLKGGYNPPKPTEYEQIINYTMLYDSGDECTDITGGYSSDGCKDGDNTMSAGTKNANCLTVSTTKANTSQVILSANKINYTSYSKLHAKVEGVSINTHCGRVGIATDRDLGKSTNGQIIAITSTGTQWWSTDITATEGYIGTWTFGATRKMNVYTIFLTKVDDISTLCDKAGVSETDLATLLADTARLAKIFENEDAVKFMTAQCTGDFMVGVLNSADAVALLKASPYLNTVVGNPHWAKFMLMLPEAQELLNVTMLYDHGDENAEVTGGWELRNQSSTAMTKKADHVYMNASAIQNKQLIDLAPYSKILLKHKIDTSSGTAARMQYIFRNSGDTETSRYQYWYGSAASTPSYDYIRETNVGTALVVRVLDIFEKSKIPSIIQVDMATAIGKFYALIAIKPDNWQTWASLGGVTASDLDGLLADSTSMATLMSNEEAVRYMVGCTGDLMVSICNSETAMNALVSNIAYDYAFNHPVWYKFMTMIPTSLAAMQSAAVSIPTMTSDTVPSGKASASATYSSDNPYKAFDKNESTNAYGGSGTIPYYVQYDFTETIVPFYIDLVIRGVSTTSYNWTFKIQGYDGTEWIDLTGSKTLSMVSGTKNYVGYPADNFAEVTSVRLYVESSTSTYSPNVCEMQVYGKAVN